MGGGVPLKESWASQNVVLLDHPDVARGHVREGWDDRVSRGWRHSLDAEE